MKRKAKSTRRSRRVVRTGWWGSWDQARRRGMIRRAVQSFVVLGVAAAGVFGLARVDAYVRADVLARGSEPAVLFLDLPERLAAMAGDDLHDTVGNLPVEDWLAPGLCREMAERLEHSGWVETVRFVRRTNGAKFEVSADYRAPLAMLQQEDRFFLVDPHGVRLPGTYRYSPAWKLIQGVAAPAPQPGSTWPGEDVRAGLAIVTALQGEAFGDQITGVLVENVGGRLDLDRSHVVLATDRAGGRIRWGSAPGRELEENTVGQKIAILRENYRRTGRVDADQPIIDISTFPDRFTIPG